MSKPALHLIPSDIEGVWTSRSQFFSDDRGAFGRSYCANLFHEIGIDWKIQQSSLSYNNRRGTLRGFHYQRQPRPENKLMTVISGRVFSVVLDLRPKSKTFCQWRSFDLTPEGTNAVILPEGCANGWMTLEDQTTILYNMSEFFVPDLYAGIRYNDPVFKVEWPFAPHVISEKDANYPDYDPSRGDS